MAHRRTSLHQHTSPWAAGGQLSPGSPWAVVTDVNWPLAISVDFRLTWGMAFLSTWAEAASVVTALRAATEGTGARMRRGAPARPTLRARENMASGAGIGDDLAELRAALAFIGWEALA